MENKIKEIFQERFNSLSQYFQFTTLSVKDAYNSHEKYVIQPGVYIFWKGNEIWKVGRHLTNARKRSLEHIRDNTQYLEYKMADLKLNPEAMVTYINVINPLDGFWIAALEIYMEIKLEPRIKSKRK